MSDIEQILYTTLSGICNVYPLSLPENPSFPAITYQRISTVDMRSQNGFGFEDALFQIDCWSSTYATARATASGVFAALDNNKTDFIFAIETNRFDTEEKDVGLYRVTKEFHIWN